MFDTYAQELKCLFYEAYPLAQQASAEMQDMGRSVLSNQFGAGLVPELKSKLAGKEGNFEQLLVIAQLEEAKRRDLRTTNQHGGTPATLRRDSGLPGRTTPRGSETPAKVASTTSTPNFRCFECSIKGHHAQDCPDRRRRGRGAPGRNTGQVSTRKPVSAVTPDDNEKSKSGHEGCVTELRQQLRKAEVEAALQKQTATMHGVTHDQVEAGVVKLGPVSDHAIWTMQRTLYVPAPHGDSFSWTGQKLMHGVPR